MDAFECLWKDLINLFVTMVLALVQFLKDRNAVFPYKSVMETYRLTALAQCCPFYCQVINWEFILIVKEKFDALGDPNLVSESATFLLEAALYSCTHRLSWLTVIRGCWS